MVEIIKPAPQGTKLIIPALGRLYGAIAPVTEPLIRLIAGGSLEISSVPGVGTTVKVTTCPPFHWESTCAVAEHPPAAAAPDAFLSKPFLPAQLVATVRALLGG